MVKRTLGEPQNSPGTLCQVTCSPVKARRGLTYSVRLLGTAVQMGNMETSDNPTFEEPHFQNLRGDTGHTQYVISHMCPEEKKTSESQGTQLKESLFKEYEGDRV